MKTNKFLLLLILFLLPVTLLTTGCSNDSMDNIEIMVTNYPNEYITKKLYGERATITPIYPDGVDINNYKISNKLKHDYAKKDLFIYNGLIEKERNLAIDLLDINPDLKIIDTAYVLETDYSPEEMWLNPSSLLMMSQNVRLGLEEYISSTYLSKDVDAAYNALKIELSELDADYRVAVESTNNDTIIVADSALKYLEKFGLNVICIDSDASDKTLSLAEKAILNKSVSYIMLFKNEKVNDNAQKLLDTYSDVQKLELHRLDNITTSERSNGETYVSIMRNNLDLIKKELYQ